MIKFLMLLLLYLLSYTSSTFTESLQRKPKVTMITSLFVRTEEDEKFVGPFLIDTVQQTIFPESEWIIIDANSPKNVEPLIREYIERYPNIIYLRIDEDPGIFGVWNMGAQMAKADLLTNVNLDDRRNPFYLEIAVKELEKDPSIDLVYGDYLITSFPNETFAHNNGRLFSVYEFSLSKMYYCLPSFQPTWRKSMHDKYGYFDPSFKSGGDLDFWFRACLEGSVFKKLHYITGVIYHNPEGLSTPSDPEKIAVRNKELERLWAAYGWTWYLDDNNKGNN